MSKNVYVSLFLFLLCATIVAYSSNYPSWPTQQGHPIQANFGFLHVATPTFTIGDSTPTDLAQYLPAGAVGFELRAKSGSFIVGHKDNIASGADYVGRVVAQGDSYLWNGLAGTFVGAVLSNSGNCDLVIDGVWGIKP